MPNVPPQNNLRRQLEELGQKEYWELLKICDPLSTKKINVADHIRTIRALEVFYVTSKPLSTQKVQKPPDWKILELGLDRDNLKERIIQRTKNMFLSVIIEETKHLISQYGNDLPIFLIHFALFSNGTTHIIMCDRCFSRSLWPCELCVSSVID